MRFRCSFTNVADPCNCVYTKNQERMISRCDGRDVYLYKKIWANPFQKAMYIDDEETTQVCSEGYCNVDCSQQKDSADCKYNYSNQCVENRN